MIAVISDIHYPSDAERQIKAAEAVGRLKQRGDISVLLVCGDFTDNRGDEVFKVPEYLRGLGCPVGFIDGNHEDYRVLGKLPEVSFASDKAYLAADNIFYLKRGGCYYFEGLSFFTSGGAFSGPGYVSRHPDIWQSEEELSEEDAEAIRTKAAAVSGKTDYILTHTVPLGFLKKYMPDRDHSATNEILDELDRVLDRKAWLFGHYHMDRDFPGGFRCLYNDIIYIDGNGCRRERFF